MTSSLPELPLNLYDSFFPTGSSIICNPPVLDTDIDYMIYVEKKMDKTIAYLLDTGWGKCLEIEYLEATRPFLAFRKGNLNFIVTNNLLHYTRFYMATKLATKLNLLKKEDRLTVFKFVVEGEVDD